MCLLFQILVNPFLPFIFCLLGSFLLAHLAQKDDQLVKPYPTNLSQFEKIQTCWGLILQCIAILFLPILFFESIRYVALAGNPDYAHPEETFHWCGSAWNCTDLKEVLAKFGLVPATDLGSSLPCPLQCQAHNYDPNFNWSC